MTTISQVTTCTFFLAVANDAENAQMNRVCGRDHDQRRL